MSDTLLIHYRPDDGHSRGANAPAQATWALCNQQGELITKLCTGALDDIRASEINGIAKASHVVVLLDSHCLHINQVQLPTQNMHKMLRAVPYALEDFIADDVDEMHFVLTANKQQNNTSVVGIHKQTLQSIIDHFNEAGIVIDSLIPDALCLAVEDKQWAILNFNQNSYLQQDYFTGGVYGTDILPLVFQRQLQDLRQNQPGLLPEKLLIFSPDDSEENEKFIHGIQQIINDEASDTAASETSGQQIELINIRYNNHPLVIFCGQYKQALPLNLLQGQFKNQRKSSGILQHWRLAASLAAVWLVLHLGMTGYQKNQLEEKNTAILNQITGIYKKTFPRSKRIVNPRVQMEQKLKSLKSGGNDSNGLLYILSESFGTLTHDKKDITLQSLNYRNNRMDIGLDSTNLQAIENLNKQLNTNPKIKAEITSSSSEKNRVKGNLRIEANTPSQKASNRTGRKPDPRRRNG